MTASEKRAEAVRLIKSIAKHNTYTQGASRDKVFETPGYGDCSSTVREVLRRAGLGCSIGSNTVSQINNANNRERLVFKSIINAQGVPDEKKMLPGDCLYFAGGDKSRGYAQYVGHVEMYIGGGKLMGHGSGKGPTVKSMKSYCKSRRSQKAATERGNRGLIAVIRWILDDEASEEPIAPGAGMGKVICTASKSANVRSGPGTKYGAIGIAKKGDVLPRTGEDINGWYGVWLYGQTGFISGKMAVIK